jgi:hypothetical protein
MNKTQRLNKVAFKYRPFALQSEHLKKFLQFLAWSAGFGLASSAAEIGLRAGIDQIVSMRARSRASELFPQMISIHPKLKDYDQDRVKLYYEQLWHFSPRVAASPLSAGNYVLSALQYDSLSGGPGIAAFKELSEIEKNLKGVVGPVTKDVPTTLRGVQGLYEGYARDIEAPIQYERLFNEVNNPQSTGTSW